MRELLQTEPYLFGPGVYDAMGAQLAMYHGFKAVYFSGYSFAIGHLGTTDMDLYTQRRDRRRRATHRQRAAQVPADAWRSAIRTRASRRNTWTSRR